MERESVFSSFFYCSLAMASKSRNCNACTFGHTAARKGRAVLAAISRSLCALWIVDSPVQHADPVFALLGFPPAVPLQSFLLKIVSVNTDGSTSITKSIPCEAGSSTEFCMAEVCVFAKNRSGHRAGVVLSTIKRPKRTACSLASVDVCAAAVGSIVPRRKQG